MGITRNLRYDIQTRDCLKKILKPGSNCIDVGAHEGEILDLMLQYAPEGKHHAFEPIPSFYHRLKQKYGSKVVILNCALADEQGNATFQFVKNAPAYSGLKKRTYAVDPEIEEIHVEVNLLDQIIPETHSVDLIKIDVEGAELGVLKGARKLIERNRPYLIFECGLGASEHYGTEPEMVYDFMHSCGLGIFLLDDFLKEKEALSREKFSEIFCNNAEYYFLAGPIQKKNK
jgi:FkbM family methyltransferase